MKANELRIGNNVYFQIDTIEIIQLLDIYVLDKRDPISGYIKYEDLMPIPLNDEWLVKLGLRKEHDEPFNWSDRKKYLQDCFLIGNYSDGLHYVRNGLKTGKPLLYVHQLQNLYFALTGEELTINHSF